MSGDASEIYQEGIIIPPVRFVDQGEIVEEVADIILSNVRTPEVRMGDLRAQVAANNLGRQRLFELVQRYGLDTFRASCTGAFKQSERMMRGEIEKIPDGIYKAEDYLENTGTSDDPIKIAVTIEIQGDSVNIDYTGTDNQVEGPVNAVWGVTLSGVYYVFRCITDPSIPANNGCYKPIEAYAPRGTLLNPTSPAPVAGGNVETSQRNVDVLLKALAQAVPDRVCAACQGTMNNVSVGGMNPRTRKQWSFYETIAGGMGGRTNLDGVDGIHTHMTNTMNTPIEVVEKEFPLLFLKYELRCDSGGAGKWRGGTGLERSWKLLAPSATISILAERTKIQPWGLFGGLDGESGDYTIINSKGEVQKLRSKCTLRITCGDVLIVKTPGGGGYGPPLQRDHNLVKKDILDDKISLFLASDLYGFRNSKRK
jgi:N-methylhydantoinase B